MLERPQCDLDGVAGIATVAAREAVGVLRPQLGYPVLGGQVLGVLGGVAEPWAAVAAVGREGLIFVFVDETPARVGLDRLAALAELVGDRAALVRRALCGVDDAGDRGELAGLVQRIAQRLLALTLAIHINLLTGRPPRALAGLPRLGTEGSEPNVWLGLPAGQTRMCETRGVLAQTIRRGATALGVVVALATLTSASAGAAAGTITEYPIPVKTTPYGITTGPDGKLWFVDSGNHAGGTFVGRMATSGAISSSEVVQLPSTKLGQAITLGPDGNMWVVQDSQIDKVPAAVSLTSEITPYALGSSVGGYGSIVPGPDGRLWFGWNTQVGAITTAGVINGYGTSSSTSVSGVTVGADGKLWYGEGNKIARMDTEGNTTASEDCKLPAGDGQINGLVLAPDGNIWFSLGVPAAVARVTPAGVITIFPTPTLNSLPFGLAVGPDKQIWFAESTGNAIGTIPTTATSGADIVEYPLAFINTNPLYVTAGPDSRMWFTEFNRGALGAITTNAAPPGTPSGGETPVGSLPGVGSSPGLGSSPGVASIPAFPHLPAPVGCAANRLILTDVFPQAGKTQVLGVAPAAAIGKKVTILSSWNGKPVATTTVRADLSFKATVAFPPLSLRFTNRALYVAKLGSVRSGALKFARRMYTTSVTAAGRTITFSGNVTPPFAKQLEPVTIRAAGSCAATAAGTIVAKVSLTQSGTFSATFQLPASLQSAPKVYLLAQTRVRQNQHSSKTYPTSTLIRGVQLTS